MGTEETAERVERVKKPHLSATQLNMLMRCPRQYAFRYLERLKMPPSGAMVQSLAWHGIVERNYKQKKDSKKDLPLDEMTDGFAQALDDRFQQEEIVLDEGQTQGKLKDEGVQIVSAHHKVIAPTVEPDLVEHRVTVDLGAKFPFALMLVLDLVDAAGVIRDNKAIARRPSDDDMKKDLQLSTYALGYRLMTRKAETGIQFDAVLKHKEPKAEIIPTKRTREDLRIHLENIADAEKQIVAEIFPRRTNGWWCSPRFCGYWSRCMGRPGTIFDEATGVSTTTTEPAA